MEVTPGQTWAEFQAEKAQRDKARVAARVNVEQQGLKGIQLVQSARDESLSDYATTFALKVGEGLPAGADRDRLTTCAAKLYSEARAKNVHFELYALLNRNPGAVIEMLQQRAAREAALAQIAAPARPAVDMARVRFRTAPFTAAELVGAQGFPANGAPPDPTEEARRSAAAYAARLNRKAKPKGYHDVMQAMRAERGLR